MAYDFINPGFYLFPIQNSRTGYKPVALPVILVVPWVRTLDGIHTDHSSVVDLRFLIDTIDGPIPVAGFDHQGLFVPDHARFVVPLTISDLANHAIEPLNRQFLDSVTLVPKTFYQAVDGDLMQIQLANNTISTIPFHLHADYYDLSDITIDTINLPYGHYKFIWQVSFYNRILSDDSEFIQIDTTNTLTNRTSVIFNHPGEVHLSMVSNTPPAYLGDNTPDVDPTIQFYRPFADALQDIFDEQELLLGLNWIDKIPAQLIPYLAYLLGWDLPFFSTATDDIRRSVLRNARRLQELKGTKLVVNELFEILGFTVDVVALWSRTDGSGFIAPNEVLPTTYSSETITTTNYITTEILVANYNTDGFGQFEIPLMQRPLGNILINGYLVQAGTNADNDLTTIFNNLSKNLSFYDTMSPVSLDVNTGQGVPVSALTQSDIGSTNIVLDINSNIVSITQNQHGPLNHNIIGYNHDHNIISINTDRNINYVNDNNIRIYKLYITATYVYTRVNVPNTNRDLRSNRFDITVLKFKGGDNPTSDIIDFLISFLFRIKAFHSLLRKLTYTFTINEVYNVLDFCLGGRIKQDPNEPAGKLQVPPPVMPTADIPHHGYKAVDLKLRSDVIAGLEAEHAAWKSLDNQYVLPTSDIQKLSIIKIDNPATTTCQFNFKGQDRTTEAGGSAPDIINTRIELCDLNGNTSNYCYTGRVGQVLTTTSIEENTEYVRHNPCELMMGEGAYYLSPIVSNSVLSELSNIKLIDRSFHDQGYVREMAFAPAQLHYYNGPLIDNPIQLLNNQFFATRHLSQQIVKPNMPFPGHRFVLMNSLAVDFTHPSYLLRPWDSMANVACPENRPVRNGAQVNPQLQPFLSTDSTGIQFLSYNSIPLTYYGNGLSADIPSMGSSTSSRSVAHSMWTTAAQSQYVVEEDITFTSASTHGVTMCVGNVIMPTFSSANTTCPCSLSGGSGDTGVDYIDGYPSVSGKFTITPSNVSISSSMLSNALITALGIPIPSTNVQLGYKLGSGVAVLRTDPLYDKYKPYRMDCNCSFYQCLGAQSSLTLLDSCITNKFIVDGQYDFDSDKLSIENRVITEEVLGICNILMDGTIPSMIQLNHNIQHFKYVDDYGIIYIVDFIYDATHMDITWTTEDPRVYGQPESGRINNLRVFKTGLVTTIHQVLQSSTGTVTILGEGDQRSIKEFQATFGCGDELPTTPFAYNLNCIANDDITITCNGGLCIHDTIRKNNIVTMTTSLDHHLTTGDQVTPHNVPSIAGTSVNGIIFIITVIDDNTFTFAQTGSNGGPVYGGYGSH